MVRALALALKKEAPSRWEVYFVRADRRQSYHVIDWPRNSRSAAYASLRAQPGDVFVGLDFSLDTVRMHRSQLHRFRRDGGSLWFLVYDLLPLERPDWFSANNVTRYKAWLGITAGIADGFLCISRQTEDDLRRALADRFGLKSGYSTQVVPMGYAIMDSVYQDQSAKAAALTVRIDRTRPFSLMVGTLEPRKGHADIVAAFSELWQKGIEHRLVIVGRMGWQIEGLRNAILNHPEYGDKLVWLDDVEDIELEQIYQTCEGVIIASHAEGYGLPLIEALGHMKPVLARDLPIFRMHQEHGVRYFPANADKIELGNSICSWIEDVRAGRVTVIPPFANWQTSASLIFSALESVVFTTKTIEDELCC